MALDKDGKTVLPKGICYRENIDSYCIDKQYKGVRIVEYACKLKGKDGALEKLKRAMKEVDNHTYKSSRQHNDVKSEQEKKEELQVGNAATSEISSKEMLTMNEAFQKYINEWKPSLKVTTQKTYTFNYNDAIKPYIGEKMLDKVSVIDVEKLYKAWGEKYTQCTFDSCKKVLKMVLNMAIMKGYIDNNVTEKCYAPKNLGGKSVRTLFTGEREIFLEYAKESWYYEFYVVSLFTGMRLGEVAGLCDENINEYGNKIEVCNNLQYVDAKFIMETPKSGKLRDIVMLEQTKQAIKSAQEKRNKILAGVGKKNIKQEEMKKYNLVFVNSRGGLIQRSMVYNDLKRICNRINKDYPEYRNVNPHALRHCFATLLNEKGANITAIQKTLGHADIKTTMRYIEVSDDFVGKEIEKLNK